jgi:exopolyphosphatase / guanosine-5'-triphosphate,3'-diphosphate pyrophosphatase
MPKIAAIDIGSNAIRMAVAEAYTRAGVSVQKNYREPVRLGSDVFTEGLVGRDSLIALLAALRKFQAIMKAEDVQTVRIAATEALRRASNSSDVLLQVENGTGLKPEILSPREESELAFLALKDKLRLANRSVIHLELGGGSLELSTAVNGSLTGSRSFELGAIRLLRAIRTSSREQALSDASTLAGSALAWLDDARTESPFDLAAGTGGSFEVLADLAGDLAGTGPQKMLSLSDLDKAVNALFPLDISQRMEKFRLKPDRADVVLPAALLLLVLLGRTKLDEIQVPRVGLKEGLLLGMSQSLKNGKSL